MPGSRRGSHTSNCLTFPLRQGFISVPHWNYMLLWIWTTRVALQKVTFKKTYFLKRRQTSILHLSLPVGELGIKVTCRGRETPPSQVWPYWPPGTLLPRAVSVSLSKAQLLISNDFSTGKKRSLLSRFSEELPTFLLPDKSNFWRLESKGITWAVKIASDML